MHSRQAHCAKTRAEYGSFGPMMPERRTIEHSPAAAEFAIKRGDDWVAVLKGYVGSRQSRILAAQQQFDGPVGMSSLVAPGFRDVVVAVEAQQADGGVAQGQRLWTAAGAVSAVVFGVGDVADPVQPVFDRPLAAQPAG